MIEKLKTNYLGKTVEGRSIGPGDASTWHKAKR